MADRPRERLITSRHDAREAVQAPLRLDPQIAKRVFETLIKNEGARLGHLSVDNRGAQRAGCGPAQKPRVSSFTSLYLLTGRDDPPAGHRPNANRSRMDR